MTFLLKCCSVAYQVKGAFHRLYTLFFMRIRQQIISVSKPNIKIITEIIRPAVFFCLFFFNWYWLNFTMSTLLSIQWPFRLIAFSVGNVRRQLIHAHRIICLQAQTASLTVEAGKQPAISCKCMSCRTKNVAGGKWLKTRGIDVLVTLRRFARTMWLLAVPRADKRVCVCVCAYALSQHCLNLVLGLLFAPKYIFFVHNSYF